MAQSEGVLRVGEAWCYRSAAFGRLSCKYSLAAGIVPKKVRACSTH
jgi:hypothetical protein